MTNVTVRRARPDDYERVGSLTLAAYRGLLGDERVGDYADELIDAKRRAEEALLLVAEVDGTVLGGVTYVGDHTSPWSEWDDPGAAGFRMLAVAPESEGLGIGRRLTAACVDQAKADGKDALILHSTPQMHAAHHLYEDFGFRRDPSLDFEVGLVELLCFRLTL